MQTVPYKIWLDNITEVAGEEWLKKAQNIVEWNKFEDVIY